MNICGSIIPESTNVNVFLLFVYCQGSPEKQNIFIYIYTHTEKVYIYTILQFKELAYVIVVGWPVQNLKEQAGKLGTQGRVVVEVQRHSPGRIPSCLGEINLCSVQPFH